MHDKSPGCVAGQGHPGNPGLEVRVYNIQQQTTSDMLRAVRAVEEDACVQDIDMAAYRKALLAAGQVLQWDSRGYNNGRRGWWTDHPQDYRKRPPATIFKGPRKRGY